MLKEPGLVEVKGLVRTKIKTLDGYDFHLSAKLSEFSYIKNILVLPSFIMGVNISTS